MSNKKRNGEITGKSNGSFAKRVYKNRMYYLLILPFLIFLLVFNYAPMYGLTLAFKDFRVLDGIMGSPWAGLKYFRQLFNGFSFKEVLENTIVISLMNLFFGWPVPIILAIFICEIRSGRVRKAFQTVSYLPHFISWVIAASLIEEMFSLNGPINAIIQGLGGNTVYFMADPKYFRWILVLTGIWKGCGWSSIIYVSAIMGIDQDLYEAARIDGANKLQEIWHITLPGMRSTIIILFIMKIGGLLSDNFDQIYNLYSPSVYSVGDVIGTYTYRQGIVENNYSYATAAGLFQNVIGFMLVMISNIVINKLSDGEEGLW